MVSALSLFRPPGRKKGRHQSAGQSRCHVLPWGRRAAGLLPKAVKWVSARGGARRPSRRSTISPFATNAAEVSRKTMAESAQMVPPWRRPRAMSWRTAISVSCTRNGNGVKQDFAEAVTQFRYAAEHGDAQGAGIISPSCTATGRGVPQDRDRGHKVVSTLAATSGAMRKPNSTLAVR